MRIENGCLILEGIAGYNVNTTLHNVNPGTGSFVYATASVIGGGITGFSGGQADRVLIVQPTRNSPEVIAIYNNDALSSVGNRILNAQGVNDELSFWGSIGMYVYDASDACWKEVGS